MKRSYRELKIKKLLAQEANIYPNPANNKIIFGIIDKK
jgi:hypothetical protein